MKHTCNKYDHSEIQLEELYTFMGEEGRLKRQGYEWDGDKTPFGSVAGTVTDSRIQLVVKWTRDDP